MHVGFIRRLDDQQIDFLQHYLFLRLCKLCTNGSHAFGEALMFQNILDQLYFWVLEFVMADFWIPHSSFMETKALTIYTYMCFHGPYGEVPGLGMEDRLAYPQHPCNVMLYCFADYDNLDYHFLQCYGWIARNGDTEVAGAKECEATRDYFVYNVGKPLRRFMCYDVEDRERNLNALLDTSAQCERCGMYVYRLKRKRGHKELLCDFCVAIRQCTGCGRFKTAEEFTWRSWRAECNAEHKDVWCTACE